MTVKEVIEKYKDKYGFAIEGGNLVGECWLEVGGYWYHWSTDESFDKEEFDNLEVFSLDFEVYTEEKTILITVK